MFWIIIFSFFILLVSMMDDTIPGIKPIHNFLIKYPAIKPIQNKNTKKHVLNLLTAYMGGFLFVVTVNLFESGAAGKSFRLFYDVLDDRDWRIGNDNFEAFFFAFIITYIIFFIRRQYKNL